MLMKIFRKKSMIMVMLLVALVFGSGSFAAKDALASDFICSPCIDLIKTGPATAMPGDTITYEFTVKNCGNVLLGSGAFVNDYLFDPIEPIWYGDLQPYEMVTFYKNYTVPLDKCGELVNNALAYGIADTNLCSGVPDAVDGDGHTVIVNCDHESPGTGTPGYWKNHPDAWPVSSIMIGGVTYSKADAIAIMLTSGKGDKTHTMFKALISAKLNDYIGNNTSCIALTITAADSWMAIYGPVGKKVSGKSYAWSLGEPLYMMLDKYNNGLLCAPHRD